MIVVLIGSLAAVVVAAGGASVALVTANSGLAADQANSGTLLAQQSKYRPVTTVQTQVNDIRVMQPIAASGEILWEPFAASVQATLPSGTTITGIDARLETAATVAAVSVPLQGVHVATVTITANSPQAPISNWLDNLASIKGFVDATPGSVALDPQTGRYIVTVTLHVNTSALADRFVKGK